MAGQLRSMTLDALCGTEPSKVVVDHFLDAPAELGVSSEEEILEEERLELLYTYDILDTQKELAFDRITAMAARMFDCEIAILSLVDKDRVWYKSTQGLERAEDMRLGSFCENVIRPGPFHEITGDVFKVLDAGKDQRFQDNPLVSEDTGVQFYAGAPLVAEGGQRLGALAVMSRAPRTLEGFSARHGVDLTDLAAQAVAELDLRRSHRRRQAALEETEGLEVRIRQQDVRQRALRAEAARLRERLAALGRDEVGNFPGTVRKPSTVRVRHFGARPSAERDRAPAAAAARLSPAALAPPPPPPPRAAAAASSPPAAGGGSPRARRGWWEAAPPSESEEAGEGGGEGEGEGGGRAPAPAAAAAAGAGAAAAAPSTRWLGMEVHAPRGLAAPASPRSDRAAAEATAAAAVEAAAAAAAAAPRPFRKLRRRTSAVERAVLAAERAEQRAQREAALRDAHYEREETHRYRAKGQVRERVSMGGQDAVLTKLKAGEYTVMKHGRTGKPSERILKISEELDRLVWLPVKTLVAPAQDDPRYSHGLADAEEIRSAREIDRDNPELLATAILRRSLDFEHADRALSVVWPHRTLDLEFATEAECQEVLHGLRELLEAQSYDNDGQEEGGDGQEEGERV